MKKILISFFTILIILPLFSQTIIASKPSPNPTNEARKEERKEERNEIKTQLKTSKAIAEIDRRIASMNKLITLINNAKRLTTGQQQNLTQNLQTEIKNLETLKAQIQGETDPQELLQEKNRIKSTYRIYAFYSPMINIISHANNIISLGEKMEKKTTSAAALAKIEESQKISNQAIDLVMKLSPEGWPANKAQLTQARDLLKQARTLLIEAWKLAKDERKGTPNPSPVEEPKPSPTPTITPTTIPSTTPSPLPTI